jgi:tetratricopeptide (TPR) repeat protein
VAMRYFQTANSLAHGANALVHIAAAVTDPTALSTLSGAANGWLALKEALNLETDTLQTLYRTTERELKKRLKNPEFHMGKTDRTALPQMLIDVRPDLSDLVAGDLNADIILSRMIKSLGDQPYERKEAFENWVNPVLEGLLTNKDLHAELAPQINRALLSRLSKLTKNTQEIKADTQEILAILRQRHGFEGVVDDKDTLSKDQLEALCLRFDPDFEETESVDAMRDFLKAKSKKFRAYRAEIDQMPDGAAQLHNLKAAAKDALDALDFEQVERLLSRVDEVETEISVATKVLRAKNALLRNRAEAAFDILDAAAAAQGSIAPLAPAKARLEYEGLLYTHGLTFGGSGLFYAVKMIERALADLDKSKDAALWATAQNNLGIALRTLGERQGGEEGIARMNDAITTYQNALQVVTKDSAEMDWAMTQNNLGIALSTLGERQSGEDAIARLKEAVTAYQKALEVYTKDNASINWAKAQVNMALVYNVRAAVFGGEKAKADLEQALFHVDAALGVFDPVHSPYNHDTATTLRERILSALNAQKG